MNNTLLYALAIPLLSVSGGLAALNVFGNRPTPGWLQRGLVALALLASAYVLQERLFQPDGLHFGFVYGLMCVAWLAALVAFVESFFNPVMLVEMLVFPFCAAVFALPSVLPQDGLLRLSGGLLFQSHLLIALAAYSLLGLAAAHALVMAYQEKALHGLGLGRGESKRMLEKLLDQLPSLMAMEATLFRQLWAGFALLSLTLISGFWFAEQWTGQVLRFDHKTLFSVLAWLSFATLLGGRVLFGWRGRIALRWCLGSYGVLILAYFGTQFVLEFILKKAV